MQPEQNPNPQLPPQEPQQQPTYAPPVQSTAVPYQSPRKPSRLPYVLLTLLVVVPLIALSTLGYFFIKNKGELSSTVSELSATKDRLFSADQTEAKRKVADNFIATYNDAKLSNSYCSGQPVGMFDVHVNDRFVVFRYLCANKAQPISIGAYKWLEYGKSAEQTYGGGGDGSNKLPGYIYDTEPAFFGPTYGTTRF